MANSDASSTFTLQTFNSKFSSDISSTIGPIILHGPHHGAQKSTNTGNSDFKTSDSKLSSDSEGVNRMLQAFNALKAGEVLCLTIPGSTAPAN